MKKLVCPVCKKSFYALLRHIQVHDSSIRSKEDFYKKFPDYKEKIQIDTRTKSIYTCALCGKTYGFNNSLVLHYKQNHFDYYLSNIKKDKRKNAFIVCPICNKNYSDIKQHVYGTHKLEWNEFCKKYNWDIHFSKYISDEYKSNLSKNKIAFYKTSRGKELRKLGCIAWKTNKNPSKLSKNKEKIIFSRINNNNFKVSKNYMGIKVKYNNITFRSFAEFTFYVLCIHFNIPVLYEPHDFIVKYFNSEKEFITTYLPDFYVNNKYLIELKSLPREVKFAKKLEKYKKVKKIYKAKNISFNIYTYKDILAILNKKCDNFEVKQIVKNIVQDAFSENKIHFICKHNSRTIKYFTGLNNLANNQNITLI